MRAAWAEAANGRADDRWGAKARNGPRNLFGVLARNKFTPVPHDAAEAQFIAW